MSEDEKKLPKDVKEWKAPKIAVADSEKSDDQSDYVQIFNVPNLGPNLSDEDKTPVVHIKRPGLDGNTAGELDLESIQKGLRAKQVEQAAKRREAHRAHADRIDEKELEYVFDDVANGRDAEVVVFIKRGIEGHKFDSLEQFKMEVEELFGGENEPSGYISMELLKKGATKLAQITVELRVEIGGSRPIVEVTLVNEIGFGRRSGENITRVSGVKIKEEAGDFGQQDQGDQDVPSGWRKMATGIFNMIRPGNKK